MNYGRIIGGPVPQSEPLPGQIVNSARGHAWAVNDWTRLERFLILGSEGGSYYATEKKLTRENANAVERCIKSDGVRAVGIIEEISVAGRAPKNDAAIFALAMAAKLGDDETRRVAYALMPAVCRTGTHLFQFAEALQSFGGWGRGARQAIANWYGTKTADEAAYQAVKYQQRDGWSHRDLLRLAHVVPTTDAHDALFNWITGRSERLGLESARTLVSHLPEIVNAFEEAKTASPARLRDLILAYKLPREALPTEALAKAETWEALLEAGMPMHALIRNLANMTRVGVIAPMMAAGTRTVVDRLLDENALKSSRVHPIAVLSALLTYRAGHGARGQNTWTPVPQVVDALDAAFYKTFQNVTPNGARTLLALDVSGSMDGGVVAGVPGLTPRVASSAMAMITAAVEERWGIIAFSHEIIMAQLSPGVRLDEICRSTQGIPFGRTDCALPMLWAMEHKTPVDTFVIYTDSETWSGNVHPAVALRHYRERMGIAAKLVVVGMVSNGFTIADPDDSGMLDVVGFDTGAPALIADFSRPVAPSLIIT